MDEHVAPDGESFLTVKEAIHYLETTKAKMARLIKEGDIAIYENPLDRRVKLVRRADLDPLRAPRLRLEDANHSLPRPV